MTERIPTTLYEDARNNPEILGTAFREVDEANIALLGHLCNLRADELSYSQLINSKVVVCIGDMPPILKQ